MTTDISVECRRLKEERTRRDTIVDCYDSKLRALVLRLHQDGWTFRKISSLVNEPYATVSRIIHGTKRSR